MRKFYFLLFCCIVINTNVWAQKEIVEDGGTSFWERVYFGGNFGLQFGDVTAIDLSPLAGYMFTNQFSAGLGVTYQYVKFNDRFSNNDFSTDVYGGRVFGRYNFTQQFFGHTEFENLNLEVFDPLEGDVDRQWVPGFFVGGGIFQPIGRSAGLSFTLLYNLLHDDNESPYASPFVIRAGFTL